MDEDNEPAVLITSNAVVSDKHAASLMIQSCHDNNLHDHIRYPWSHFFISWNKYTVYDGHQLH